MLLTLALLLLNAIYVFLICLTLSVFWDMEDHKYLKYSALNENMTSQTIGLDLNTDEPHFSVRNLSTHAEYPHHFLCGYLKFSI